MFGYSCELPPLLYDYENKQCDFFSVRIMLFQDRDPNLDQQNVN